jgi:hypothetical protein
MNENLFNAAPVPFGEYTGDARVIVDELHRVAKAYGCKLPLSDRFILDTVLSRYRWRRFFGAQA